VPPERKLKKANGRDSKPNRMTSWEVGAGSP
jgi:hypothetical protein